MNEEKRKERCDTCRFWIGLGNSESGKCHRYPPVINPAVAAKIAEENPEDDSITLGFEHASPKLFHSPVTWDDDFCGEWQAKQVPLPVVEQKDGEQ